MGEPICPICFSTDKMGWSIEQKGEKKNTHDWSKPCYKEVLRKIIMLSKSIKENFFDS